MRGGPGKEIIAAIQIHPQAQGCQHEGSDSLITPFSLQRAGTYICSSLCSAPCRLNLMQLQPQRPGSQSSAPNMLRHT